MFKLFVNNYEYFFTKSHFKYSGNYLLQSIGSVVNVDNTNTEIHEKYCVSSLINVNKFSED